MEHDLVLEGKVVAPGGLLDTEIGVTGGVIAEIARGLRGSRRIRAGSCLIFPGFLDMHVHLREPGWEKKEDFRTGTLAAVHGGVTTVADMPNNPTPTTTPEALAEKERLAAEKAKVDVKCYGGVAAGKVSRLGGLADRVVGFKLYLSETTGTGAFPASEMGEVFELAGGFGRPVSLHCEMQSVIDRKRAELAGAGAPDLHCDVRPPEAEVESVEGVLAALKAHPAATANICHASTGETVRLVGAARAGGLRARCEAALHHLYFNRRAKLDKRLLKTNPPLRPESDREALLEGVRGGAVSFLVTDHAPHLESEKAEDGAAGVPGLDDYGHVVSWLIKEQGVAPGVIARIASENPARHLLLGDRGEIAVGKRGDFTILDLRSPEKVTNDRVLSKCGWSPYEGREFPGRARWTISRGEVLSDDFEVVV